MEISEEITEVKRTAKVRIQYDFLPKYCTRCKLQAHANEGCRVLHPELVDIRIEEDSGKGQGENSRDEKEEEQSNKGIKGNKGENKVWVAKSWGDRVEEEEMEGIEDDEITDEAAKGV
ncbi:hypothetical protein HAX54_051109 [Datura stramonium]|uniref:Zinc knuckle CX2CX4HX4C domain-containing protein n=1 Tax=Datura stramonium TaxID=4076 RepID=A0ABS8SY65_DATST|nr:hypothetical protein [Datura stramonium]